MTPVEALRVPIAVESDVGIARIRTHGVALDEGFGEVEAAAIATAVSELARNVLVHAGSGELVLAVAREGSRRGIVAVVEDQGPGIADVPRALEDGFSTTASLGLGLPSARRLVDQLDIVSIPGTGTTVTATKWRR